MVEHIQDLDKVLFDLKQVGVIIARAKFQFYWASIKIVRYIYDANGRYSDISKVLKILDWLKYTNTIIARAFIGIHIYYWI